MMVRMGPKPNGEPMHLAIVLKLGPRKELVIRDKR